jgi:hypothetical protein
MSIPLFVRRPSPRRSKAPEPVDDRLNALLAKLRAFALHDYNGPSKRGRKN